MQAHLIGHESGPHWLDIVDPGKAELEQIGLKYGLHPTSIQDCLDPEHLAKTERIDQTSFIILRSYDDACPIDSDTMHELTRKVAVFISDRFIITVHRKDQPYLAKLRDRWKSKKELQSENLGQILLDIFQGVLVSYDKPIDHALNQLELLEMGLFEAHGAKPFNLIEGYYLKRRAFVIKRMVRSVMELIPKVNFGPGVGAPTVQSLREDAENSFFYTDEILETITGLLNLHVALSSQRTNEASHETNEVIRVLTIFSMFLLPLNLVTGIYGMNFSNMPELQWTHGYAFALSIMLAIVAGIYLWFRRKGWLKKRRFF